MKVVMKYLKLSFSSCICPIQVTQMFTLPQSEVGLSRKYGSRVGGMAVCIYQDIGLVSN